MWVVGASGTISGLYSTTFCFGHAVFQLFGVNSMPSKSCFITHSDKSCTHLCLWQSDCIQCQPQKACMRALAAQGDILYQISLHYFFVNVFGILSTCMFLSALPKKKKNGLMEIWNRAYIDSGTASHPYTWFLYHKLIDWWFFCKNFIPWSLWRALFSQVFYK